MTIPVDMIPQFRIADAVSVGKYITRSKVLCIRFPEDLDRAINEVTNTIQKEGHEIVDIKISTPTNNITCIVLIIYREWES